MTLRLLANEVKRQNPDWKAKDVNQEASRLQGAISSAKNSMLTWHAPTPLVRCATHFGGWLVDRSVSCWCDDPCDMCVGVRTRCRPLCGLGSNCCE